MRPEGVVTYVEREKTAVIAQNLRQKLVVEEAHAGKAHRYAILIAALDNYVVTDRSAGLCDVLNAALLCALDVIAEREECIRAECHAVDGVEVGALLLAGKGSGLLGEVLLPVALSANVLLVLVDISVNYVISVRSAESGFEGKSEGLKMQDKKKIIVSTIVENGKDINLTVTATGYVQQTISISGSKLNGTAIEQNFTLAKAEAVIKGTINVDGVKIYLQADPSITVISQNGTYEITVAVATSITIPTNLSFTPNFIVVCMPATLNTPCSDRYTDYFITNKRTTEMYCDYGSTITMAINQITDTSFRIDIAGEFTSIKGTATWYAMRV